VRSDLRRSCHATLQAQGCSPLCTSNASMALHKGQLLQHSGKARGNRVKKYCKRHLQNVHSERRPRRDSTARPEPGVATAMLPLLFLGPHCKDSTWTQHAIETEIHLPNGELALRFSSLAQNIFLFLKKKSRKKINIGGRVRTGEFAPRAGFI
jgi:hypothetical protein